MSRKPTIGPQSVAVVEHLKLHGASTLEELRVHFGAEGRGRFAQRLSNLVYGNWLDISYAANGDMLYLVAPRARAALPKPQAPASAPPVLVPPRRISVMAGTYTPPPMAPARPGALNYQRVASHGVRC